MDKLYVIAIRHNPQIGAYLSKAIVAKAKVNKTCITAKYNDSGYSVSLRFSLLPCMADGRHFCISRDDSVYGSYEHIGFSDKAAAIAELKKWTTSGSPLSSTRAQMGIAKFEAA